MTGKKMKWEKAGWCQDKDEKKILYVASEHLHFGTGCPLTIESRRRHIPHTNGEGTWDHTTFFVLDKHGNELAEKQTLKAAKEFAEATWEAEGK